MSHKKSIMYNTLLQNLEHFRTGTFINMKGSVNSDVFLLCSVWMTKASATNQILSKFHHGHIQIQKFLRHFLVEVNFPIFRKIKEKKWYRYLVSNQILSSIWNIEICAYLQYIEKSRFFHVFFKLMFYTNKS